jgi:Flp pilus assembly protein TadG
MTRDDRGAAAVELALVLPLLLLLVFGIIDFGRALNAQIEITSAAREGARWAALGRTDIAQRVTDAAPGLSPAPTTTYTACANPPAAGSSTTVTATTTYTLITPLSGLAGLFGGALPGTLTLTGRGVMRCGG